MQIIDSLIPGIESCETDVPDNEPPAVARRVPKSSEIYQIRESPSGSDFASRPNHSERGFEFVAGQIAQ